MYCYGYYIRPLFELQIFSCIHRIQFLVLSSHIRIGVRNTLQLWTSWFVFYTYGMPLYSSWFFITEPISNNRFDYLERVHPQIYVPSLIEGALEDVQIADSIAIETYVWDTLKSGQWLQHFIFLKNARVPTWICDNHNHAFAFWFDALQKGYIQPWSRLVHIDQHTDLATPQSFPQQKAQSKKHKGGFLFFEDLLEVQEYVNTILTIADFIVPALATGLLSKALMVTGESTDGAWTFIWLGGELLKLQEAEDGEESSLIVDLDLDYFAQWFDEKETFSTVMYWLAKADIVTIATSPLFIDQHRAITILKSLQNKLVLL